MSAARKPGTSLPWGSSRVSDPSGQNWIAYEIGQDFNLTGNRIARTCGWLESPSGQDAAYIAHACNQYGALVAALSELVAERANDFHDETEGFNMAREALKNAGEV